MHSGEINFKFIAKLDRMLDRNVAESRIQQFDLKHGTMF
jgi:hypothetical protein